MEGSKKMSGKYNQDPIKETFLLGTRFPNRKSIAICMDSVRSQEYYEIVSALYKKNTYDYDYMIFTSDNNSPALVNPCALYYYNYIEHYRGDALALTIRSAINLMQSGCILNKKVWYISDITGMKEISKSLPAICDFFDEIVFVNEHIRTIFLSFFPFLNESKTSTDELDIMLLEKRFT
jgi:hypothetical protein